MGGTSMTLIAKRNQWLRPTAAAEWSNMMELINLDLENNDLTGPLPDEWANMLRCLLWVDLSDNQLTVNRSDYLLRGGPQGNDGE